MGLTALDIIVLLLVGGGAVFGFMRGLVQEVLSLLAWVLAIAAVRLFHPYADAALSDYVGTEGGSAMLSFALLFGIVFALGKWLSRNLGDKTRRSFIGNFDRALGAGFGMVKGLVIASLVFMLASLAVDIIYGGDAERPAWMRESRTYPALSASSSAISEIVAERRKATKAAEASKDADGAER
jgi:membrane protein required for colicin V production